MFIEAVMLSKHLILYQPLSSCPQYFPALGSFPMNQFFASGGQIIGASASASVLNIQGWFPLGLTGLISILSKRLSKVFSNITIRNINSLALSLFYSPTLTSIHDCWENHSFDYTLSAILLTILWLYFVSKVMSLLLNVLSRFVIAFLPRSKLLISWL